MSCSNATELSNIHTSFHAEEQRIGAYRCLFALDTGLRVFNSKPTFSSSRRTGLKIQKKNSTKCPQSPNQAYRFPAHSSQRVPVSAPALIAIVSPEQQTFPIPSIGSKDHTLYSPVLPLFFPDRLQSVDFNPRPAAISIPRAQRSIPEISKFPLSRRKSFENELLFRGLASRGKPWKRGQKSVHYSVKNKSNTHLPQYLSSRYEN